MQDVLISLTRSLDATTPFVFCRLVETRGSTPQKAGAMMLVFPDGRQAGTLGGGCVEADVKRTALRTLAAAEPQIATFQLDHDYGWDDGLICGGRVKILVQPFQGSAAMAQYYRSLVAIEQGATGTEAIVFDTEEAGAPVASRYLFDAQQQLLQTLNAPPGVPENICRRLKPIADRPRAYAVQGVAYLPALPRCRLVVVGGGHIGKAVAELAARLEFDVWVVDDRSEFVSAERFPAAQRRLSGDLDELLPRLDITPDTYCLIVTRGHSHDEQALFHLIQHDARYVGMIGSRRKIRMIFDDLLNEGISAESLRQVYAPLGIDIGSQTVAEIAVSICAELVAHRNLGGHVPGRSRSVLD